MGTSLTFFVVSELVDLVSIHHRLTVLNDPSINTLDELHEKLLKNWHNFREAVDSREEAYSRLLQYYLIQPTLIKFAEKANVVHSWLRTTKAKLAERARPEAGGDVAEWRKFEKDAWKTMKQYIKTIEKLHKLDKKIQQANANMDEHTPISMAMLMELKAEVENGLQRLTDELMEGRDTGASSSWYRRLKPPFSSKSSASYEKM